MYIQFITNFKVITPQGLNLGLVKVAQLIDEVTGMWKVDLIRKTFFPHDADLILGIPLSPRMPEDSLIWAWSKNGNFTVRSAYRVALKTRQKARSDNEGGECSNKGKIASLWELIWQLKCPNKIKHFLWRAFKNILPTNFCLASRKVTVDCSCGFCGGFESSGHALWDCVVAMDVWKEIGLNLPILKQPIKNFVDVVWALKEMDGVSDWELFAITAWMVWNNRNVFKHEGRCKDPKRIASEAKEYAMEVTDMPRSLSCGHTSIRSKWCPPKHGRFKVNVDGAVFSNQKCCGIGVVIRNEEGQIMGAMSRKLPLPLGTVEVEAVAMEEGINLARDLGLWEVEIESDAQVIVKAVTDADLGPSSIRKVVEGIKMGLGSFRHWSVSHIRRHSNNAAHIMARESRGTQECQIWVEDTPSVIANQIQLDVICEDSLS
ncbi:hypothetical protein SO802_008730 [Lithocarpus litseifolius]|uniref:RNase H type-1 domain-containing protein n=1 Tax=Lithocarpus litseifolius TaxID=425828 RepID=A0AAW2DC14_9ROSI